MFPVIITSFGLLWMEWLEVFKGWGTAFLSWLLFLSSLCKHGFFVSALFAAFVLSRLLRFLCFFRCMRGNTILIQGHWLYYSVIGEIVHGMPVENPFRM
ncbi:hypothetical protein B0I35DRAFT_229016 [Stachybotrys elegans]|uniref:Uncharacterized protein n=1 Tax=Stachybotrys elegans TaxID=80388 RepID=A0A8K0WT99_9HYPO|nr:hypothetical protein B0I35DRAFT_229016 [Stachybotrys elegans]